MDIDIRQSIINNFKGSTNNDIVNSIESSIKDNQEITLPGMGVFFELLWKHSDPKDHESIINTIKKGLI